MSEILIFAFLGHLVGDFLLQSKNMALDKSKKGRLGFWVCTMHVATYTVFVCLMIALVKPSLLSIWFAVSILIPHFIIDRYSLAKWWLKIIKGRTFDSAYESKDVYRDFDIAFTSIVYTVVDNTFHLLCLTGSIYFFL
jgi:hypothetical protein